MVEEEIKNHIGEVYIDSKTNLFTIPYDNYYIYEGYKALCYINRKTNKVIKTEFLDEKNFPMWQFSFPINQAQMIYDIWWQNNYKWPYVEPITIEDLEKDCKEIWNIEIGEK